MKLIVLALILFNGVCMAQLHMGVVKKDSSKLELVVTAHSDSRLYTKRQGEIKYTDLAEAHFATKKDDLKNLFAHLEKEKVKIYFDYVRDTIKEGQSVNAVTADSNAKLLGVCPTENGNVTYSGVIQVANSSQNELYKKAVHWLVTTYNNASVLQLEDPANSEVTGRGQFKVLWMDVLTPVDVDVVHTINIKTKDGKVKYEFTDFRAGTLNFESFAKNKRKFLERTDKRVNELISSLIQELQKKEKDW